MKYFSGIFILVQATPLRLVALERMIILNAKIKISVTELNIFCYCPAKKDLDSGGLRVVRGGGKYDDS
jgi:hypothetical protein